MKQKNLPSKTSNQKNDYSRSLVLFSGGADSTYFLIREPTAKHLLFFSSINKEKTKMVIATAAKLGRYLTIENQFTDNDTRDGEINQIHALFDTEIILKAAITALKFGLNEIVVCFNQNDIGVDINSIEKIMRRAEPNFKIHVPLQNISAKKIRTELKQKRIAYVSCMVSDKCDYCPKCIRGY